ncbi:MAG: hypothetical protein RLY43_1860, partial [Bacteroidota bacterium]
VKPSCDNDINSIYKKTDEIQRPGYFESKLYLDNNKLSYKVTTSQRNSKFEVNYHCKSKFLYVNFGDALGESGLFNQNKVQGVANFQGREMSGFTTTSPPYSIVDIKTYFYLKFSDDLKLIEKNGKYFKFKIEGQSLKFDLSASYASSEGAKNNYLKEGQNKSFEEIHRNVDKQWNELLSRVEIDAGLENKKLFYTFLWNSLRGKSVINDADGSVFLDGKRIHSSVNIYNTDSMWGSNYTLVQLWGLIYPEFLKEYSLGLLKLNKIYGIMPDGWAGYGPVKGMTTNTSANIVIAAMNFKLIPKTEEYINALITVSGVKGENVINFSKSNISDFYKYKYIPSDIFDYSDAASTIEYSYDNSCLAKNLDNTNKYKKIIENSSLYYKNIFNYKNRLFVPRLSNGSFVDKFDSMDGHHFNEGNSIQYRWSNVELIKFFKSKYGNQYVLNELVKDINSASKYNYYLENGNTSGYTALRYNHGNQVSQIAPFAFHMLDRSDLSNYYSKQILSKFYSSDWKKTFGAGQDDDQGQLSAWYVLASIGLFDLTGGCESSMTFAAVPSLYDNVMIKTDKYQIKKKNINNINAGFSMIVNKKKVKSNFVNLEKLIQGAILEFYENE